MFGITLQIGLQNYDFASFYFNHQSQHFVNTLEHALFLFNFF